MSDESGAPADDIREFLTGRYRRFRAAGFPERRELFGRLAAGQSPRILFIACSDSRVVPSVILAAEPGDIFECRVVGNIVPKYGDASDSVAAAIEFAVTVLGVEAVIVCGHSDCGAMKAIHDLDKVEHLKAVATWVRRAEAATHDGGDEHVSYGEQVACITRENVIVQLEHLRTHPAVAAGMKNGLQIFGWVYDIGTGDVVWYDEQRREFLPLEHMAGIDANSPSN